MRCDTIDACFEQIRAYFIGSKIGHPLLVNTENYDIYQGIRERLETMDSIKRVYLSENCLPNGLPDADMAVSKATGEARFALLGLSQAQMLRGGAALEATVNEILHFPIQGHGVVLLDHCERILDRLIAHDRRAPGRVLFAPGSPSPLPQVRLVKSAEDCIGTTPLPDFPHLLSYLERLTDAVLCARPILFVSAPYPAEMFTRAVYAVASPDGVYTALAESQADIAGATEESYGSNTQWSWLAARLAAKKSLSALVCEIFGSTANLSAHIPEVWEAAEDETKWFLWLSLKIFGEPRNQYLTYVLGRCTDITSFLAHIYWDLCDVPITDARFDVYYAERKRLIGRLPENLPLVQKYCEKLGRHRKDAIFYLTDGSEPEKFAFLRCLGTYRYTEAEIGRAVFGMSQALSLYMREFLFDAVNTKLSEPDAPFREALTTYFRDYKLQKLTNRIFPEFLERVEKYARSPRPYNKLPSRSSILAHMDKKNAQLFFFDALGVEYLSFILAKCEEYGLVSEVSVGRCELPSITVNNKEFYALFQEAQIYPIRALDEIKHHSLVYDYRKCPYPLHLFEELEVIEEQLRGIRSMLVEGRIEKAILVADHGASRLAVLCGRETDAPIPSDEAGEHSGRCCPAPFDPALPYAAYEGGFAVLANYERFQGGRRANVEVHGGASLEEVVVPVITLTKRPTEIEICFIDPVITLKPRCTPELVLYANIPLHAPRLCIDGCFYEGVFLSDPQHAKFEIPAIKRKGTYAADVYDGEKNMSLRLEFKVQKQTREVDLF